MPPLRASIGLSINTRSRKLVAPLGAVAPAAWHSWLMRAARKSTDLAARSAGLSGRASPAGRVRSRSPTAWAVHWQSTGSLPGSAVSSLVVLLSMRAQHGQFHFLLQITASLCIHKSGWQNYYKLRLRYIYTSQDGKITTGIPIGKFIGSCGYTAKRTPMSGCRWAARVLFFGGSFSLFFLGLVRWPHGEPLILSASRSRPDQKGGSIGSPRQLENCARCL